MLVADGALDRAFGSCLLTAVEVNERVLNDPYLILVGILWLLAHHEFLDV